MKQIKADRVFHILESKGYECRFSPNGVNVYKDGALRTVSLFEPGRNRGAQLNNTAKFLAHTFGIRYNAPLELVK